MKGLLYFSLSIGFRFFLVSFLLLSCESQKSTNDGRVRAVPLLDDPGGPRSSERLKIFVMVGQSNMQGHGYMDKVDNDTDGSFLNGTLEWMVETYPETYGKLKTYDETGSPTWKKRDDVWIAYNRQKGNKIRPELNQHGQLVAGFGGDAGQEGHQMGPELGFGWTIGDALGTHKKDGNIIEILLVKIAWGGKSLAVNFRPPSSGGETGLYYEATLANIYKTLSRLSDIVPGYTPDRGYSLEGFAWHQGWNDGLNNTMTAEYESNLVNLIRDIRMDLGVPDLPVAIGVSGMNGWQPCTSRRSAIIEAQMAVANATKYPEFENNVASVETRDFYRDAKPYSPGDQIYHWNNNCESYWLIGQAMGEAMVDLIHRKEASSGYEIRSNVNENKTEIKNRRSSDENRLRGMNGFQNSAIEQ